MSQFYFEKRSAVPAADCWNLAKMYPNHQLWEKDFAKVEETLPDLLKFHQKLKTAEQILQAFTTIAACGRILEKVYTYASHLSSVDLSDAQATEMVKKAEHLYSRFSETIAYVSPELAKLSKQTLENLIEDQKLVEYKKDLQYILLSKDHILTAAEEALLAKTILLTSGPESVFSALDNIDLTFGEIKNEEGKKVQLTSGNFLNFLEKKDPKIRQKAFKTYYQSYQDHIHTYAEILNAAIRAHHFTASTKKYSSCLEAALFRNQINTQVYHSLLQFVHQGLPELHRYFELRKQKLGLAKMHMWDLRVSLFEPDPLKFTFSEAVEVCLEALKPLGESYCDTLRTGLLNGWVDKYESKGKRGGAFSGGCYDSDPYILMNFSGTLNDVYTLIHEAGHSMHSYLARTTQPYNTADYSIFTAEIASTVNERLLTDYLLQKYSGDQRQVIITSEIDAIRATYFRQAMFAEFELKIHQQIEKGLPLTKDFLCNEYQQLNQLYYGPALAKDPFIQFEWARIPHFYYNFYVYQYATGIAAAYYLSQKLLQDYRQNSTKTQQQYLHFLSSGGNDFPNNQLLQIGVDFTKPDVFLAVTENLQKYLQYIQ